MLAADRLAEGEELGSNILHSAGLLDSARMCCKTIFTPEMSNIDSRRDRGAYATAQMFAGSNACRRMK